MSVTAIERAVRLLQAVPESNGTISELSRETGLPVATVSRIMGTLERTGAVLRAGKQYRIGPTLVELAGTQAAYDLSGLATSHINELAASTNETAGIAEAVGDDVVHLAQVATDHDVAVRDWTGELIPMHHGCIGFVIMAHWEPAQVERYLATPLEAFSPRTLTDADAIRDRLEEIRKRGWLWTTDEFAQGVTTVAAPIRDRNGEAVASLHAHGPSYRFPAGGEGEHDTIGRDVADGAESISGVLGWRDG